MTWEQLLREGRAERHRTSEEELDALRAVVRRNLADAKVAAISADTRFACAYEAALILVTMMIAQSGYRVKGPAHHMTTFQVLPLAMDGKQDAEDAGYFDRCRRLRNELSYEAADIVNERDVAELLHRVAAFERRAEQSIASRRRDRGAKGESH